MTRLNSLHSFCPETCASQWLHTQSQRPCCTSIARMRFQTSAGAESIFHVNCAHFFCFDCASQQCGAQVVIFNMLSDLPTDRKRDATLVFENSTLITPCPVCLRLHFFQFLYRSRYMKQQSQQVSEYFCPICRAQAHEVNVNDETSFHVAVGLYATWISYGS